MPRFSLRQKRETGNGLIEEKKNIKPINIPKPLNEITSKNFTGNLTFKDNLLSPEATDIQNQEFNDTGTFLRGVQRQRVAKGGPFNEITDPNRNINLHDVPNTNINNTTSVETDKQRIDRERFEKDKIDRKKNFADGITKIHKDFNLGRGDIAKNKQYYNNFDATDKIYGSVLKDIEDIQQRTGRVDLTDRNYNDLSKKYGLDVNQIKNPNSIFDRLTLTNEGEKKFGQTKFTQDLEDSATNLKRYKEDLATNLKNARINMSNQIDDVNRQIKQNLNFIVASGVWSGAIKSSGYEQGMDNLKDDADRVISRLESSLERSTTASNTKLERTLDNYKKNTDRAKSNFSDNLKENKENVGVKLSIANKNYSGDKLIEALKELGIEYQDLTTKSVQAYQNILRNDLLIAKEEADLIDRETEKKEEIQNRRFNEYKSNDGLLLNNISISQLAEDVKNDNMTLSKMKDLQNIMTTKITNALGANGIVTPADTQTIQSLLENDFTPQQIVAKLREDERFQGKVEGPKIENVFDSAGNKVSGYFDENNTFIAVTPEGKILQKETGVKDIKKVGDRIFEINKDGTYKDITGNGESSISITGNGNITQDYGKTSPVKADNVKLANGLIGTPGIDIDGVIGDNIMSFSNGTVVAVQEVNESGGFGRRVIIKDDSGKLHMYNHLNSSNLNKGDTVTKGQVIAQMGNTGTVIKGKGGDGSHLDYRVSDNGDYTLKGGNWIDPKQFMENVGSSEDKDNFESEVLGFTQGLGGDSAERGALRKSIINKARQDNISLLEAKKELGYKTGDDKVFMKTRGDDFRAFKKELRKKTSKGRDTLSLLEQPQTAIGDVASLVGFLKTIDPTSVARESEVAAVEGARGTLDSISNTFKKIDSGVKLTSTQREEIKNAITTIVESADRKYQEEVGILIKDFDKRGLDSSIYISGKDLKKHKESQPRDLELKQGGNIGSFGAGLSAGIGLKGNITQNKTQNIGGFNIDVNRSNTPKITVSDEEMTELDNLFK